MQTLLITGGCGFIGSNFIAYMINKYPGRRIVNLDALTYAGSLENLEGIENSRNYLFINGNICDKKLLRRIFRTHNIDQVINIAAESHVDRSIKKPVNFIKTNITGTLALLETARDYWSVPDGHIFLQVSTDEVYGSLGDEGYFSEDSPIDPHNPYSISKASADLLVRSYFEMYGLPVNITRCCNNFGPRQHHEKLIPLTIHNAISGKPVPIYGDGLNVRDWIFVEDHCTAIDAVLQSGRAGEIYNVSAQNERKNIDVVVKILHYLKNNYDYSISANLINFVEDRRSHDRRYAIKPDKIMDELNWRAITSFEDGLEKTIEWYLNHKPGWNRGQYGNKRRHKNTDNRLRGDAGGIVLPSF